MLAAAEDGKWLARLYNPTPQPRPLRWQAFGAPVAPEAVNLDGSPCPDDPQLLKPFEIKTVLLTPRGKEA